MTNIESTKKKQQDLTRTNAKQITCSMKSRWKTNSEKTQERKKEKESDNDTETDE